MARASINSNKGFTINMSHYVKQVSEIKDGFIINGNSMLRIYVDSTYNLGYFFGASVSRAVVNLSNYRGQVFFRMYDSEDSTKLFSAVEDSFNVTPRIRKINSERYEMIVYSKPIAKLLKEFGKGQDRMVPSKYLVENEEYLNGLRDGIYDFQGHIPDNREVLKRREFSPGIEVLYEVLTDVH